MKKSLTGFDPILVDLISLHLYGTNNFDSMCEERFNANDLQQIKLVAPSLFPPSNANVAFLISRRSFCICQKNKILLQQKNKKTP